MKTTKRKAISKKETINSGAGGQWHAGTTDGIVLFNKKKVSKKEVVSNRNRAILHELSKPVTDEYMEGYKKGYDDGARSQAKIFNDTYDNAQQVKKDISWGKWDIQINWCAIILGIMLLGIVVAMITTNYEYGFINA